MKLLAVQFSPVFRYFLPPTSKGSLQYPVLNTPRLCSFLRVKEKLQAIQVECNMINI